MIRTSQSAGSSAIVRWSSSSCGSVRQNGKVGLGPGNGPEVIGLVGDMVTGASDVRVLRAAEHIEYEEKVCYLGLKDD